MKENFNFKQDQYIICKSKSNKSFIFIYRISEAPDILDVLMLKTIKILPRLFQNPDYPAPEIIETKVFLRRYEIIEILDTLEDVIELYPEEFI